MGTSTLSLILVSLALLVASSNGKKCANSPSGTTRLVCYYRGDAALEDVDVCSCTHLVYTGDERDAGLEDISKTLQDKRHKLKVLLRITEKEKNLPEMLKSSTIHGVEIFESHSLLNKTKVTTLTESIRSALGSDAIVTLSLPAQSELLVKYYDVKALAKSVSMFVLETHSLGDVEKETFHPSRLSGVWDMLNTDSVVDLAIGLGVPSAKIIITAPAKAYKFILANNTLSTPGSPTKEDNPTYLTQKELCKELKNGDKWTLERDQDLSAPYAFKDEKWIAFEDSSSVDVKGKYARIRGLAGLGLVSIDDDSETDCGSSLLQTIAKGFGTQVRAPRGVVLSSLENEILSVQQSRLIDAVQLSPYRISRIVDSDGIIHAIREDTRTEFECQRQGYFVHPRSCNRFYRCVKFNQLSDEYTVFEFDCPAGLEFDARYEVCVWPGSLSHSQACPGSSEIAPVPRTRFVCPEKQGYYADPENCRWFFACLDHGKAPLSAYEFRCPFGLGFDESRLICDWPWLIPGCGNVGKYESRAHGHSASVLTGNSAYLGASANAVNVAAHQSLISGANTGNLVGVQGGYNSRYDLGQQGAYVAVDNDYNDVQYSNIADSNQHSTVGTGYYGSKVASTNLVGSGISSSNVNIGSAASLGGIHYNSGAQVLTDYSGASGNLNLGAVNYNSGAKVLTDYSGSSGSLNSGAVNYNSGAKVLTDYSGSSGSLNLGAVNYNSGAKVLTDYSGSSGSLNLGAVNYNSGAKVLTDYSGATGNLNLGAVNYNSGAKVLTDYSGASGSLNLGAVNYNSGASGNLNLGSVDYGSNVHLNQGSLDYNSGASAIKYGGSTISSGSLVGVQDYTSGSKLSSTGFTGSYGGSGISSSSINVGSTAIPQYTVTAIPHKVTAIPHTVTASPHTVYDTEKTGSLSSSYFGIPQNPYSSSQYVSTGQNVKSYGNVYSNTAYQTGDIESGQYYHDNSGDYKHDSSGEYKHDYSGEYFEKAVPYQHIEGAQYPYRGSSDSGAYVHDYSGEYRHDYSGAYKGDSYYSNVGSNNAYGQYQVNNRTSFSFGTGVNGGLTNSVYLNKDLSKGSYSSGSSNLYNGYVATGSGHTLTAGAINSGLVGKTHLVDAQLIHNSGIGSFGNTGAVYSTVSTTPVYQSTNAVDHDYNANAYTSGAKYSTISYSQPGISVTPTPIVSVQQPISVTPAPQITYTPLPPKSSVKEIFGYQTPAVTYVQPVISTTPKPIAVQSQQILNVQHSYNGGSGYQTLSSIPSVATVTTPSPFTQSFHSESYVSNSPKFVSSTPKVETYVSSTPSYVSSTSGYVASSPSYVSSTPGYVASSPSYVSSTPGYVASSPSYVSSSSGYVASSPSYVSTTPKYVSSQSYVSSGQNIVSSTPSYVSSTPTYVSSTPSYVSSTPKVSITNYQSTATSEYKNPLLSYTNVTPAPILGSVSTYVQQPTVSTYVTPSQQTYVQQPLVQQTVVSQPAISQQVFHQASSAKGQQQYYEAVSSVAPQVVYEQPKVSVYTPPTPYIYKAPDYLPPKLDIVQPVISSTVSPIPKTVVSSTITPIQYQQSSLYNSANYQQQQQQQYVQKYETVSNPTVTYQQTYVQPKVTVSQPAYVSSTFAPVTYNQQTVSSYNTAIPIVSTTPSPIVQKQSFINYIAPQKTVVYEQTPAIVSSTVAPIAKYEYKAPVVSSYEYKAPVVSSYEYKAPAVVSSYEYKAPAVSSYEYKAPVVSSYEYKAPAVSSYEYKAPAVSSYEYKAPAVSSYEYKAPAISSYDYKVSTVAPQIAVTTPTVSTYTYESPKIQTYAVPKLQVVQQPQIQVTTPSQIVYQQPAKVESFHISSNANADYNYNQQQSYVSSTAKVPLYESSYVQNYEAPKVAKVSITPTISTANYNIVDKQNSYYEYAPPATVKTVYQQPAINVNYETVTQPTLQYFSQKVVSTTPKPIIVQSTYKPVTYTQSYSEKPVNLLGFGTVGPDAGLVSQNVYSSSTEYIAPVTKKIVTSTYAPITERYIAPQVVTSRPKVAIVTKVNDYNPLIVKKLGAVCSCKSNVLRLRRPKPQQEYEVDYDYNSSYDQDNNEEWAIKSTASPIPVKSVTPTVSSQYLIETTEPIVIKKPKITLVSSTLKPIIVPDEDYAEEINIQPIIKSTLQPIIVAEEENYPVIKTEKVHRIRTRPQRVKAVTIAPTLATVLIGESQNRVEIKSENEVTDTKAFDRYGPGGWRGKDETLQGSIDCQRAGLFRHPKHCNKFYSCVWDCTKKRFTLHVLNCPVKLNFDPSIGACNWPSQGPACQGDTLISY